MPILFICPDCASTLHVPDTAGGRDTRCPKCYAALIVPEPGERTIDADLLEAWSQTEHSRQPPKLETGGYSPGFLARLRGASSAAITAFIGGMRSDAESLAAARNDQQGCSRPPETDIPTSPFALVAVQIGRATAGNSAVAEPISNLKPPETATVYPPKPLAESADSKKNRPPDLIPDDPLVDLGSWGASHDLEAGAVKRVGDVEVALGYKFSTAYAPQNAHKINAVNLPHFYGAFVVGYRRSRGSFNLPTAGLIPVNGEPQKVKLVSRDPSVVRVRIDGSASFHRGGKAQITAQVAGTSIAVSVRVIEFPLNAGTNSRRFGGEAAGGEDVVRCLGFPDQRTPHFVVEPEFIDGIYYGKDFFIEHWTYKKYPGAILAIAGHSPSGWLWCVGTHKDR